ncbi:TetR family transcriptional regulator [Streptomyces radicis]|uniref:acyl-CoA-like ligand-binding transcription factor n=1 Tax=Streptomyces radicis TaxID=1750517 RepID=UPI0011C3C33A|nr:TetR family transcriptional regulator [Streptomyces radicis]
MTRPAGPRDSTSSTPPRSNRTATGASTPSATRFAAGLDAVARRLRDWPADRPLGEGVEWGGPTEAERNADTSARQLLRMLADEPGLRAVWLRVHHDAEPVLTRIIAERTGADPDDPLPRIKAVMLNGALRVAAEEWAGLSSGENDRARAAALREAVLRATADLGV